MTTHAKLSPAPVVELCTRRIDEINSWRASEYERMRAKLKGKGWWWLLWLGRDAGDYVAFGIPGRHADQLDLAEKIRDIAHSAVAVYLTPEDHALLTRPVDFLENK